MAFQLTPQDITILQLLAEYRTLSVRHTAALLRRNTRALRRRLHQLEEQGIIRMESRSFGSRRGRPEQLLSVDHTGVDVLKAEKILNPDCPDSQITIESLHCLDHHLLVNDLRMQLLRVQEIAPTLKTRFLSPISPLLPRTSNGFPLVRERFRDEGAPDGWVQFTPDGVLSVTDTKTDKTVLFFLEADMGTEALVSSQHATKAVRQKIINYQACFRREHYKRYEQTWNCRLRGFRLLFLTHSSQRMAALCRLVRDMRPSDFVWLTDRKSMTERGIWADIWAMGGRFDIPLHSILDSQAPDPAPRPDDLVSPAG